MSILEVKNLHKSFGGLKALQGIELSVNENELVGLIGPNGCGKSTTFNVISGVIPGDKGSVKIFDNEVFNLPSHKINLFGMSRTYQNTRLWRELTVIENLMLPPKNQIGASLTKALFRRKLYKEQENNLLEIAYETLELLEISHMAHNYASELSGGQSKLVDIGRVLMSDPSILLLDEPVAGVAGPLTEKIFHKIKALRDEKNISVLIIEHDMEFILRQGIDRIYVMAAGKIIASGTPDDIRSNQKVIDAYLGE